MGDAVGEGDGRRVDVGAGVRVARTVGVLVGDGVGVGVGEHAAVKKIKDAKRNKKPVICPKQKTGFVGVVFLIANGKQKRLEMLTPL
jgi:hypothetical protein